MGKASKWFKGLFGLRKWSFVKSQKDHCQNALNDVVSRSERNNCTPGNGGDVNITACVRERGAGYGGGPKFRAAVMIQSHFRAYLSKRALRALKGLVKLQALVRGHLVRKQTAYAFRQLQALVRAQSRARSGRALVSQSPHSTFKSSHFTYPDPQTPEKFEHAIRARSMKPDNFMTLKRNGSNSIFRTDERTLHRDDELRDPTREADNEKPHFIPKHRRSLFHSSQSFSTSKESTARQSVLSPSFGEVQSLARDVDPGAFTPTKSDGSRSCLSGYSDHPNYMAYTKSSKAKVRSLSAPKQRPIHYERSSSTKKYFVLCGELMTSSSTNFANKVYPGSGRLDRLGVPVRDNGFSGGLQWQRY